MSKRGRPRLPDGVAKANMLTVRLKDSEMRIVVSEAAKSGEDVSAYVIRKLAATSVRIVEPTVLDWANGGRRIYVQTPEGLTQGEWERLSKYVEVLKPTDSQH